MRQDKTLKVILNHYIPDENLHPNAGSDKAWTWKAIDYGTETGTLFSLRSVLPLRSSGRICFFLFSPERI